MKKFLFTHHKLAYALIHIAAALIFAAGFALAILLSDEGDMTLPAAISLFSSIIAALAIEICFEATAPLKYYTARLKELTRLSHGRVCYTPALSKKRSEVELAIAERLEKMSQKSMVSNGYDGFVGRWRGVTSDSSKYAEHKKHYTNYYLYSVEHLDSRVMDGIEADLAVRLSADRAGQLSENDDYGIVNAIAVLADTVDHDVVQRAKEALSVRVSDTLVLRGIRFCIGEVSAGRYYLSAERDGDGGSRTNRSLLLLSKATFGVGAARLDSLGTAHTEAYTRLLRDSVEKPFSELVSEAGKKENDADPDADNDPFAGMNEGDIRRDLDVIYTVRNGISVTGWLMTPKGAMDSFDDEGDIGDLEDIIAMEDGDVKESEPAFAEDYRGAVVLDISPFGMCGKRLRRVSRKMKAELHEVFKQYLISEGFERVYEYDEKHKTIA